MVTHGIATRCYSLLKNIFGVFESLTLVFRNELDRVYNARGRADGGGYGLKNWKARQKAYIHVDDLLEKERNRDT